MNRSVGQYIELYEANRELLGERPEAAAALQAAGELPEVYAPEDYGLNLQRLAMPVDVARSFRCAVPSVCAAPALVVNDIYQSPRRLPQGVTMMSLRRAAQECPELIPSPVEGIDDAETQLNRLLATDGVLLRVGRGVQLEKPLQLVNILSSPVNLMVLRRLVIVLEPGAKANLLVCDHTQDDERQYLDNELIEVTLEAGASLTLDRIEESSERTVRRAVINASLADDSSLNTTSAVLTCGDSLSRLNVTLRGAGASARVNGMVIASGEQKPAFHTRICHLSEHTTSNQTFKYVADGHSSCDFRGLIVVDEAARFTEAYQTNHNLLAADTARMHTEPALEIYCDEVKCSHGATTGQLDAEALFYMRQRGIDESTARHMLMEAFVADVIASVGIESLRDRLRHLVERRFANIGSCSDCQISSCQ